MDDVSRQLIADLVGRGVGEIATELDEIEACVGLYEFNKGEIDSMPKRSKRAAELRQFQAALEVLLSRKDTVERVLGSVADYVTLLDVVQRLKPFVDQVIQQGDANSTRGPDPDDRQWLITTLAEIFEHLAEEKATVTTDPVTNEISGRFFAFVRLAIPRVLFADVTLGDQVKRHLRSARST
jgi:hypothetical protein